MLMKRNTGTAADRLIPECMREACVPIDSIRLDPNNPRKNDKAAPELARLIAANGFRKPIIVDENGIIRAGNTTYKAAKILGLSIVPVIRHTFGSEAAALAYSISDNRAAENSEWDVDVLRHLETTGKLVDRESLGFTAQEWSKLTGDDLTPADTAGVPTDDIGNFIMVRFNGDIDDVRRALGMGQARSIDLNTLLDRITDTGTWEALDALCGGSRG